MNYFGPHHSSGQNQLRFAAPIANTDHGITVGHCDHDGTGTGHIMTANTTGVFLANAHIIGDLTVTGTTVSGGTSTETALVIEPAAAPTPTTNTLYNLSGSPNMLHFNGIKIMTGTLTDNRIPVVDGNGLLEDTSNWTYTAGSPNEVYLNGDMSVTGDVITESNSSDGRLKDVHSTIDNGLERLKHINPVEFKWNKKAQDEFGADDEMHTGLIAQEVEKVLPDIVKKSSWSRDYKAIKYERMVPLLLSAIKQLQKKVDSLEAQLMIGK